MNDLYVVRSDNPIQTVYAVGPAEYEYDPSRTDCSLPLDSDDLDVKKKVEHRYYERYQLKEGTFALIRPFSTGPLKIYGKSMGCMACAVFNAKPVKLGKIDNISMGGLMFDHADDKTKVSEALVLDILLADCGFYLADIPFKIVTDVAIHYDLPGDPIDMRKVRLQFQKMTPNQRARLKGFLFKHGIESGEIGKKKKNSN